MTEDNNTDDVEKEIKKTVQLVAYIDTEDGVSVREMASKEWPSMNWFEMKQDELDRYYLRKETQRYEIDKEMYELLSDVGMDDARVEKEVTTESKFRYSETRAAKEMLRDIMPEGVGSVPDGYEWSDILCNFRDSNGDDYASFYSRYDEMPLLKHPSEIDEDDMYEGEEDIPCFKWKIKVEANDQSEVTEFSDKVLHPLITELSKRDFVGEIRWYDCEVQTKEKGVCLNI